MTSRLIKHFAQGDELATFSDEAKRYGAHILDVDDAHPANCIISGERSSNFDELHEPLLDDDQGVWRIVPSRSPGHNHVYIDKHVKWGDYCRLLTLLVELELVDPQWADLSMKQGAATLRLPVVAT